MYAYCMYLYVFVCMRVQAVTNMHRNMPPGTDLQIWFVFDRREISPVSAWDETGIREAKHDASRIYSILRSVIFIEDIWIKDIAVVMFVYRRLQVQIRVLVWYFSVTNPLDTGAHAHTKKNHRLMYCGRWSTRGEMYSGWSSARPSILLYLFDNITIIELNWRSSDGVVYRCERDRADPCTCVRLERGCFRGGWGRKHELTLPTTPFWLFFFTFRIAYIDDFHLQRERS